MSDSASPSTDLVELELHGPIALLRLNRPAVHNVVSSATIQRLEERLATLDEPSEVVVLILTGAGEKTFCAGSDLDEITRLADASAALPWMRRMQKLLDRLSSGPQVVLAALNGSAYGGGCELLTACHLRLAPDTAHFSFRQAALGLMTGWGGGGRLFRQIGRSRALRLLLTADTVDARTALELGLIDRVLPREQVREEAFEMARRIAANNPASLRGFLRLADTTETRPGEDVIEVENELFRELFEGDFFRRRAAEWRARRNPRS